MERNSNKASINLPMTFTIQKRIKLSKTFVDLKLQKCVNSKIVVQYSEAVQGRVNLTESEFIGGIECLRSKWRHMPWFRVPKKKLSIHIHRSSCICGKVKKSLQDPIVEWYKQKLKDSTSCLLFGTLQRILLEWFLHRIYVPLLLGHFPQK